MRRMFPVLSLQELCCRAIVARTSVYGLERLPLPTTLKSHLKSYAISAVPSRHRARASKHAHHTRLNCTGRNSCTIAWVSLALSFVASSFLCDLYIWHVRKKKNEPPLAVWFCTFVVFFSCLFVTLTSLAVWFIRLSCWNKSRHCWLYDL